MFMKHTLLPLTPADAVPARRQQQSGGRRRLDPSHP